MALAVVRRSTSCRRPGGPRVGVERRAGPPDLVDRRVEITGPPERKMTVNALNSGARVWLADLEDANTPHWSNVVGGQVNLRDAIRREVDFTSPDGKRYAPPRRRHTRRSSFAPRVAPRREARTRSTGRACGRGARRLGLHFFHNAAELLARGSGPYFYLPKMESHLEARLWNDVFVLAQERARRPHGSVVPRS